jgi:predicted methyltransferase
MDNYKKFVISGYHIAKILKHKPGKIEISLDLGITKSEVTKTDNELIFPDGQKIQFSILEKAIKKRHLEDCFLIEKNLLLYIYIFENSTVYKLYESNIDWSPTLFINGSVMHAISVSSPIEEAKDKAKTFGNISGNIFDTCFGLGYTSIELIKNGAENVYTCEPSKGVIEIAKINPWSREAFENEKINLKNVDVLKEIVKIKDNEFDYILHDPPNVKINGDLYSLNFYKELHRVLKPNGKLYHFIGGGRIPREYKIDYTKGVIKRLLTAGFIKVDKSYRGVLAWK